MKKQNKTKKEELLDRTNMDINNSNCIGPVGHLLDINIFDCTAHKLEAAGAGWNGKFWKKQECKETRSERRRTQEEDYVFLS